MPTVIPLDREDIGHIEWAGFIGEQAGFASAEGQLHVLGENAGVIEAHDGLLVAAISQDKSTLFTAGEDGKVCSFSKLGELKTVFEAKGKWIDRLATGPAGAIGFAWGKQGVVVDGNGEQKPFDCERSIEGIAFQPKGMRLALARYNGVELQWINTPSKPQFLEWAGAHTDVIFSPDGNYVVSTMQENALHGWRLSDDKHMRMSGYPAKVKSISWSVKGKWLASSGAPAAIAWSFAGKDGPMGKAPKELAKIQGDHVTHVCCHPTEEVIAVGYASGLILAVRIEDNKEAVLRRGGQGAISSLNWDVAGKRIAYGSESGEAGIIYIAG